MKKLFLIAVAFVAVSLSYSCSKSQDEDDEGGGERNKPVKLVSKIQGTDSYGEIESYSFYYDQQNRLSKIVEENSWDHEISGTDIRTYTKNISYSGNTIQIRDDDWGPADDYWTTTVATISNGLINSATATSNNNDKSIKSIYIYNGNYLVKAQSTAQEGSDTWSWVHKVEWNNGDLTCQLDDETGDKATYEYTDILNKTNIDFNGLLDGYNFDETAIDDGFTYGLLGSINKHLTKSTSWIDGDSGETYTSSLSYDLDKEGCPTAIRIKFNDNDRISEYHITYK